jgi:hypothetical protein
VIFLVSTFKSSDGREKVDRIIGPYRPADVFEIQRERAQLRREGADTIYRVQANGTDEARTKILKKIGKS